MRKPLPVGGAFLFVGVIKRSFRFGVRDRSGLQRVLKVRELQTRGSQSTRCFAVGFCNDSVFGFSGVGQGLDLGLGRLRWVRRVSRTGGVWFGLGLAGG